MMTTGMSTFIPDEMLCPEPRLQANLTADTQNFNLGPLETPMKAQPFHEHLS